MAENNVRAEGTGLPWGQALAKVLAADVEPLLVELFKILPRAGQLCLSALVLHLLNHPAQVVVFDRQLSVLLQYLRDLGLELLHVDDQFPGLLHHLGKAIIDIPVWLFFTHYSAPTARNV